MNKFIQYIFNTLGIGVGSTVNSSYELLAYIRRVFGYEKEIKIVNSFEDANGLLHVTISFKIDEENTYLVKYLFEKGRVVSITFD